MLYNLCAPRARANPRVVSTIIEMSHMDTSTVLRHHIIKRHIARQSGTIAEVAIRLWTPMADKIISIVGEGGFAALYERSVHQVHTQFSWLRSNAPSSITRQRFNELQASLDARPPDQASAANTALLITFTDILASLIGEQLTMSILRSAWGSELMDDISEGLNNE